MSTYRWNTTDAAAAFDAGAPAIHPFYVAVQDEILDLLPFKGGTKFELIDLGGGSGRLAERVLTHFPGARVTVVDQSEPFLALAEQRLRRFGRRAETLRHKLQDDWLSALHSAPNVIVSMSAIHHLEPHEKQALYRQCHEALVPGGLFINGDEFRPADDAEYLALLEWWWRQKDVGMADGRIPDSFRPIFEAWHERNITRFGEPKQSGDDCLETAAVQCEYLREMGFRDVRLTWNEQLWGVLFGRK